MGLPVVRIISAVTPLVLGALDLYRRRSGAEAAFSARDTADSPAGHSGAGLGRRLRALEQSELEQARLLSELSRNVESLAKVVAAQQEEIQRREARARTWLLLAFTLAAAGFGLAAWAVWQ